MTTDISTLSSHPPYLHMPSAPFNITELTVTHSYVYSSAEYLDYCEETNATPTEQGFYEFLLPEIQNDFPSSTFHPFTVTRHNSDSLSNESDAYQAQPTVSQAKALINDKSLVDAFTRYRSAPMQTCAEDYQKAMKWIDAALVLADPKNN